MIKVYAPMQMDFAANILVRNIKSLGHSCERVGKLEADKKNLWIIYNSAMAHVLPSKYISYQTEQNGTHWFNDKYRERLRNSVAVWEYCESNLFEYQHPNITLVTPGIDPQPKQRKDLDVVFYGAINGRRKAALNGIKANIYTNLFGDAMRSVLARAKTVLNIHYYEPNGIESFRLNEALSYNCNVLSEYALHGCEPYNGIVKFGEINELKHLLTTVGDFNHNISHLDNIEQIKEALAKL